MSEALVTEAFMTEAPDMQGLLEAQQAAFRAEAGPIGRARSAS
jgi:hypothetical protein